jgi:hypothetical protein
MPNIWVLLALLVGTGLFVTYLLRVPRDYPLRGKLLGISSTVLFVLTAVVLFQAAKRGLALSTAAREAASEYIAARPAHSLVTYVPLYPGADVVRLLPAPSQTLGGRPSTRWATATNAPVARVVSYYRDPAHHVGWTVEVLAESGVMLKRSGLPLGQAGVERMRIQARPASSATRSRTIIEYELTRRL